MRTATRHAARDTVTPTLHKAQDTLTDTVLPAVRDAFITARERGTELLDTDIALEARRRGNAVVRAARGEPVILRASRWRFGLGMVFFGSAIGYGLAWLRSQMRAPTETFTHSMSPVPSGTVSSAMPNGAAPAGTAAEDIDLRSGAPTTR